MYYNKGSITGQGKTTRASGFSNMCPVGLGQRILVYKTHAHGQVAGSNQPAAWFTDLVFGNLDAVAGSAAVGIYSKTMLANAANFSTQVLYAETLVGFSRSDSCAGLESLEDSKSLCFWIDVFHIVPYQLV